MVPNRVPGPLATRGKLVWGNSIKAFAMMLVHRAGEAVFASGLSILLFATLSAAAHAAPPTKRSAAASCDRAQFRVVLDVGHTAQSPGAASARGVDEFDFNLRLAKEINRKLLDMGFTRTVLLV